jgi:hypothetical protein
LEESLGEKKTLNGTGTIEKRERKKGARVFVINELTQVEAC